MNINQPEINSRVEQARRTQAPSLNLSNLAIIELPTQIGELRSLKILDLSGNKLTILPESIGQLEQLNELNVSNNQLAELPKSLLNLHSLKALYLHNNPELKIPIEILGSSPEEIANPKIPQTILDYYFSNMDKSLPLNEAKLILVGSAGVGKTSLISYLVSKEFNNYELKTDGINITEWNIQLSNNEKIVSHIWDFGGQEIMHATHQFFLTKRSLYILVLSGRGGDAERDAEYWLRLIENYAGSSPVIIVLNKIKSSFFNVDRRGLQQKFPSIRDFIETDCVDGTGIEDLRRAIKREIDRLENVRIDFPIKWFKVKDQLENSNKNFITNNEYQKLCSESGITDKRAQEKLISYLHDLGTVFNFRDDLHLQNISVTNPHWVTNGIYTIFNSPNLREHYGEFSLEDLNNIFNSEQYPLTVRHFLIDLMEKFDLCFNFPNDKNKYLIPQFLPIEEPPIAFDIKHSGNLNFEYHYSILPSTILPRFIVRTHAISQNNSRWQNGVVLEYENCLALVKADTQEKKVIISISGNPKNRRNLLTLIRKEFENIHRDFSNLTVSEMIPLPNFPDVLIPYEKLIVMEENNVQIFQEVINNNVVGVNVSELLNGIRHRNKVNQVKIFCSYSHTDKAYLSQLKIHLKALEREGLINIWHDQKIDIGDSWKNKIDENLENADIILLLVSASFLSSDYCYEVEMKRALERHAKGEAHVIPIIIRSVDWTTAPFGKLQALPKDGIPISSWSNRDSAFLNVARELRKVILQLREDSDDSQNENLIISKIKLKNIRCFEDLNLSFLSEESASQFILFFGDNGVGKTSILRSIALGLCDESTTTSLMNILLPETMLRKGCKEGSIEIEVVNSNHTKSWIIETVLEIEKETQPKVTKKFPDDFPRNQLFICGYGSARRGFGSADYEDFLSRDSLMTLFDYNVSLQNPELALRRIEAQNIDINNITQKIDSVLMLDPGSTQLANSGIRIKGPWGDFSSIGGLGDGFQATIGWIADWFGWAYFFNSDILKTELSGIILIDEIEQHLHPSWQREIIRLLHQEFPKVQFIATTHSPMCALGTTAIPESEVKIISLTQQENYVSAVENIIPRNQRADQVLTSSLFGLFSASSFDVSADIEKYGKLASQKSLSNSEKFEMKELEKRIQKALGPYKNEMERKIDATVRSVLENDLKEAIKSGEIDWKTLEFQIRNHLQGTFNL